MQHNLSKITYRSFSCDNYK